VTAVRRGYEGIPPRGLRIAGAFLALAVVACVAIRARSVLPSLGDLGQPALGWLAVAIATQVASLAAYALVVRRFLRLGNVVARMSTLLRATVGGIAMGASLPGGHAASLAYWYTQLRKEGAGRSLTALTMAGTMLAGVASLAVLFVVAVLAAGGEGPLAELRTPILVGWAALLLAAVALRRRATDAIARLVRRFVPDLPRRSALGRRGLAAVAVLSFANWLLDCACLWAALAAVHATVPVHGLLLVYTLSRLVANLPLLPGGGGTVEATLALGFAAFGGTTGNVLAGVLLFRLVSCWGSPRSSTPRRASSPACCSSG
jgi:putative heme transporter